MEKMAVVAPMPKASVRIAVKVNPGDVHNRRSA
jgi:hypothetical protein